MRLLIVEDDAALARGILKVFRHDGLAVDHVSRGRDALEVIRMEPYSAVVLDLGLPDIDGLQVLKQIRQSHIAVPILILTARDATADRVTGLDQGADDYLSKPFAIEELEARVRALIRRGQGSPDPVVTIGPLTVDRNSGATYIRDELIDLTRRERAILETLAVKAGTVIPKSRLTAEVFGYDDPVAPNALEVHIGRLRRKLEDSGVSVITVRGLGYLLRVA